MIVHFPFSFLLDLPNLQSILLYGYIVEDDCIDYWNDPLQGDDRDDRKAIINGHESFANTLIMKSMLK